MMLTTALTAPAATAVSCGIAEGVLGKGGNFQALKAAHTPVVLLSAASVKAP